jgi:hypothetical protein
LTDDMIERVARAMARQRAAEWPEEYSEVDRIWHHFTGLARAAIAAMREPTDTMDDAGGNTFEYYAHSASLLDADATVCWRAMIDAALKGQQ